LDNDDLLRPTLSDYRRAPALYSSTGFFLSGFFGGPIGTGVYGLCNSYRLGRLKSDLPVVIALVAAAFFVVLLLNNDGQMADLATLLGTRPARTFEVTLRAMAMACFGAIYLMHRKFFRAARVSGAKSLSSWVTGIVSTLVGFLSNTAFIAWILTHH